MTFTFFRGVETTNQLSMFIQHVFGLRQPFATVVADRGDGDAIGAIDINKIVRFTQQPNRRIYVQIFYYDIEYYRNTLYVIIS